MRRQQTGRHLAVPTSRLGNHWAHTGPMATMQDEQPKPSMMRMMTSAQNPCPAKGSEALETTRISIAALRTLKIPMRLNRIPDSQQPIAVATACSPMKPSEAVPALIPNSPRMSPISGAKEIIIMVEETVARNSMARTTQRN